MTLTAALLAALLAAAPESAPAPGQTVEPVRVERRVLVKRHRLLVSAGGAWLARSDWYSSPALAFTATFFPSERGGLELRAVPVFASLTQSARDVISGTGLVPDAHRPRLLGTIGWRHALAYGKTFSEPTGVLHFELLGAAHAGVLVTEADVAPAASAGPAVLLRLGNRFAAQLDVHLLATFEQRRRADYTLGTLATLTVGAWPW